MAALGIDGRSIRVAGCKKFQDYYINVITQKLGAQIYADGLKHSLELRIQSLKTSEAEKHRKTPKSTYRC